MEPVEDIYERAVEEEEEEEKRISILLCGDGVPQHSRQRRLLVPSVSSSRDSLPHARELYARARGGGRWEGGMS